MKRIVTVQDISCVGKCSLTVALPIISALGCEAAILPTAVLSTHTMFKNFTCKDLTDQISPILDHWESEKVDFSAIYTGYLGSFEQIDLMKGMFDRFKREDTIFVVDPAMADNGKLYPAFDTAFARHMATLCAKADVIIPNITEACYMTDTEYRVEYDEAYVKALLLKLTELGAKKCLLTGVSFQKGTTGVMGYDSEKGEFYHYSHLLLSRSYHGTGDIFSSTFVGAMMKGLDWKKAATVAADYTAECIRVTLEDPDEPWYGVNFEKAIPYLLDRANREV